MRFPGVIVGLLAGLVMGSIVLLASPAPASVRVVTLEREFIVSFPIVASADPRRVYYTQGPNEREQVTSGVRWTTDVDPITGDMMIVLRRDSTPMYVRVSDDAGLLWEGFVGLPKTRNRAVRH